MKNYILKFIHLIDIPLAGIIWLPAYILKIYRKIGSKKLKICTKVLKWIGVMPIRDHYYEPLFLPEVLKKDLREERVLPGIDLNKNRQLELLNKLNYDQEFIEIVDKSHFNIDNNSFVAGDAEFLYQFIRYLKPSKVIEVGSGNSTIITHLALDYNKKHDGKFSEHICIEPFEQPWLEEYKNIRLYRNKLEDINDNFDWKNELCEGDLLFIDSSHIIRPQGDVLTEYLSILPSLNKGVYVHVHDIFTPRDYLNEWLFKDAYFWNEQYLLEALLSNSDRYEVVASLNWLKYNYYEKLKEVTPYLNVDSEPGSFYLRIN